MEDFFNNIVHLFGFTKDALLVSIFSVVQLLICLLTGIISGLALAYGGPRKEKRIRNRASTRFLYILEGCVITFVIYYQAVVAGTFSLNHGIYWIATMVAMPLFFVVGSQVIYLSFYKKIEKNRTLYREWIRLQRMKKRKARLAADGDSSSKPVKKKNK